MKYIKKSNEPEELANFKAFANENWQPTFREFRGEDKRKFQEKRRFQESRSSILFLVSQKPGFSSTSETRFFGKTGFLDWLSIKHPIKIQKWNANR